VALDDDAPTTALLTTRDGVQVACLSVPGEDALRRSADLARAFPTSGLWPIIVGNSSNLIGFDELGRFVEDGSSTWAPPLGEILGATARLDPEVVLREMWQDGFPIDEDADDPLALASFDETMPTGPVRPIPSRLARPAGAGTIALFPVGGSHEIPAVLGWGDWNACPPPAHHVAVLRYWRERYGADVRAMSHDTIELGVSNPPTSFEAAIPLARQQYAYASDIIDQGEHATVGSLAGALVASDHWHFWWD
jgi:hypothetical protein